MVSLKDRAFGSPYRLELSWNPSVYFLFLENTLKVAL
jgi:hypothetical protein